jgi:hypothetical protein
MKQACANHKLEAALALQMMTNSFCQAAVKVSASHWLTVAAVA